MSYADDMVERLSNPEPFRTGRNKPFAKPYRNWAPDQGLKSLENKLWTMVDGETIRLGDMTPAHRGNCVRLMIKRHGEKACDNSPMVQAMRILGIE